MNGTFQIIIKTMMEDTEGERSEVVFESKDDTFSRSPNQDVVPDESENE